MKGGFSVRVKFDESKDAEIIYRALSVESFEFPDDSKFNAKLYLDGNTLTLLLQADGLSSLRAGVNTWLRLIKVCKDVVEAVKR